MIFARYPVIKDNDNTIVLFPSLSDGPSGGVLFIRKPKNGFELIQLAINNLPEPKQHIGQYNCIQLIAHIQ